MLVVVKNGTKMDNIRILSSSDDIALPDCFLILQRITVDCMQWSTRLYWNAHWSNAMHTLEGKCNAQWRNANEFNAHTAHWRNAMQCTLEKEGMQCNAQWGNAKQCTLHTGGGSAMHPWHLSGQPLHLVDEMLMPWAVQSFSVQWRVQFGRCTVHHVVYVVNQGCSAVKLLHKTKSNAVLVEFVKLSYSD